MGKNQTRTRNNPYLEKLKDAFTNSLLYLIRKMPRHEMQQFMYDFMFAYLVLT